MKLLKISETLTLLQKSRRSALVPECCVTELKKVSGERRENRDMKGEAVDARTRVRT